MNIEFRTKKLRKECEDPRIAQKRYGAGIGNKLTQRIRELTSATSLKDIELIPSARLHRLQGSGSKEYAVDLVHPFRLVIKPILEQESDISKLETITIVKIEEVEDYHGKQKR
jgi:proteic killer suppression protein